MLYLYNVSEQTVAAAAPLEFSTIGVLKGRTAVQTTDTTVNIYCPGVYEVNFYGTATAAGTVQLQLNGEDVVGALSEGTTLVFTVLVQINPNCCAITTNLPARLQVINTGDAALTLSNAGITVVKVG